MPGMLALLLVAVGTLPCQERRPVQPQPFVLTLVDDLGQPLRDIEVQLGIATETANSWRWRGFRGGSDTTDAAGRITFPMPASWDESSTLRVNVHSSDLPSPARRSAA
jgi:hypothetical protein